VQTARAGRWMKGRDEQTLSTRRRDPFLEGDRRPAETILIYQISPLINPCV